MKPKVSIIVPIYNVQQYMKKGIDSVLEQTLKEIEVILVNDGSTDESGKIAEMYAKIDERVKVIHQSNKGLPGARNAGLKIASGEYIGFVDPDDWIEDDMIEQMYISATKNNSDIVVCNFIEENIRENHYEVYDNHIGNTTLKEDEIKTKFIKFIDDKKFFLWPSVCNKIYKREFLDTEHIWQDETLKIAEDLCFNINAIMKANIISGVNKNLYHYMRINPNSLLNRFDEQKVYNHMHARKKIIEYLKQYDLDLNDYIKYENSKNLRNFIDLCIFKIKESKSNKQKYKDIKNILSTNEFLLNLQSYDKNYLSIPIKFIIKTIRLKLYWITYGILSIYVNIKKY